MPRGSSSLGDPTPEGSSVVELAERGTADVDPAERPAGEVVPFTAQTRMSGLDLADGIAGAQGRRVDGRRVGRASRARAHPAIAELDADRRPRSRRRAAPRSSSRREAPTGEARVLGVIHLKDVVKDGLARALRRAARAWASARS